MGASNQSSSSQAQGNSYDPTISFASVNKYLKSECGSRQLYVAALVALIGVLLNEFREHYTQLYEAAQHGKTYFWPPSRKSAPGVCAVILSLIGVSYWAFFRKKRVAEWEAMRAEKNERVLVHLRHCISLEERILKKKAEEASRMKALPKGEDCPPESSWEDEPPECASLLEVESKDESDAETEESVEVKAKGDKNSTSSKDESESKAKDDEDDDDKIEEEKDLEPPTAKEVFELLHDPAEERSVTEMGIDPKDPTYLEGVELLKRVMIDELTKGVTLTKKGREELPIEEGDNLKYIKAHSDGLRLEKSLELYKKKVAKAFGYFVPKDDLDACKKYLRFIGASQRKKMATIWDITMPLLPMYIFGLSCFMWDSITGPPLWHRTNTCLDELAQGKLSTESLRDLLLCVFVKFILCAIMHLTGACLVNKTTSQFRLKLKSTVMRKIMGQDTEYFDWNSTGKLQERLNRDTRDLSVNLFEIPKRIVWETGQGLSNIYAIYMVSEDLLYIVILPIIPMVLMFYYIVEWSRKVGRRMNRMHEEASTTTSEMIKEIRTVRQFAMEGEESTKFHSTNSYLAATSERTHVMRYAFGITCFWMFLSTRLYAIYIGGGKIKLGEMQIGSAIQVSFASMTILHSARCIMDLLPEFLKIFGPLGRVCEILNSKPKIEPIEGSTEQKLCPKTLRGHIELKNVDFSFPTEPNKQVLKGLSFIGAPGKKIGIVGATGCGKSTSIHLVQRLYQPDAGEILLDGKPIQDYDVHYLRRKMSVVAQDNVLFSETIRDNITYGIPKAERKRLTEEDIKAACVKANAWGFIKQFPRKLETFVGERGVKLSGGQKQRLAIARAIIRKPTILLLDEATSALDAKAERAVQVALDRMVDENKAGCTLIIAHRLTTIKSCDTIVVMDDGRKVESGTHDELMAIPITKRKEGGEDVVVTGWYHDLWDTQMGEETDNEKKVAALEAKLKEMEVALNAEKQQCKELQASVNRSREERRLEVLPGKKRASSDSGRRESFEADPATEHPEDALKILPARRAQSVPARGTIVIPRSA